MKHELNMIDYLDWLEDQFMGSSMTAEEYKSRTDEKKKLNKSQPKLGDFVPTNEKGEVMVKKNISAIEEFNGKDVVLKHQYGMSDSKDLYLSTESSGRLEIEDGWIYLYDKGKSGKDFKKAFQRSRIDKIGYRIFWIAPIEYQSALDRVIWKGWEVEHQNDKGCYLNHKGKVLAAFWNKTKNQLEVNKEGLFETMKSYEKLINSGVKLERIQGK